jgi:acyl carrier protein
MNPALPINFIGCRLQDKRSALVEYLRTQVAKVLGAKTVDPIQSRESLFDLGIDSLMTIELRNILESELRVSLSATFVFDYPTIDVMARYLAPDLSNVKPDEVDLLSESEAEELLLQELERLKY